MPIVYAAILWSAVAWFGGAVFQAAAATSPPEWRALSERTRARMEEMDEIIRDPDSLRSYERYFELFAPDIVAHGLYETGATDMAGLRKHYYPVFFELRDGVLLSDEIIVAGSMSAQRYHALLYLQGEFDGVRANGQAVFLRGQTFFRFDVENRIIERWSNHDHAFRLQQLRGAEGAEEGRRIAAKLNGPGLSESAVIDQLAAMNRVFNIVQLPAERQSRYLAFFSADVKVHGVTPRVAGRQELSDYLANVWTAFPDLERVDEARLSAWSLGAVRWRALGSHRARYGDLAPTMRPVRLRGETIMRFNAGGAIVEIWMNVGAIESL